jgi:hypothetical protein
MPVKIDGSPQTPQDTNHLSNFQQRVAGFVRSSREVTTAVEELLRWIDATDYLQELGDESPDTVLTGSSNARTVGKLRKEVKAACSFAVLTGDLTEPEANAIVQTAYGNDSETIVPSDEIKSLTDQWV